ncbi:MAG: hypothetical protein GF334_06575 [Candidatus Altiarchaeales archaeon]|nr:hypothetical protein [Candidatus Altiarchaeales archaeon]
MGVFRKDNSEALSEICSAIHSYKQGEERLEGAVERITNALKRIPSISWKKAAPQFHNLLRAGNTDRAMKLAMVLPGKSYRTWVYVVGLGFGAFGIYAEIFL